MVSWLTKTVHPSSELEHEVLQDPNMKCVKYVVLVLDGIVGTPMSIPAYTTDPAVTALENALLASRPELLTVIAPSVTVI